MIKLYIPEIGDNLEIQEDVSVKIYAENRNETIAKLVDKRLEYVSQYNNYSNPFMWVDSSLPSDYFQYQKIEDDYEWLWEKINQLQNEIGCNPMLHPLKQRKLKQLRELYNPLREDYRKSASEYGQSQFDKLVPCYYFDFIIKKGTVLKVDRVYIRKNAAEYSSLSFRSVIDGKKVRFWIKLEDVNNLYIKNNE
jgi:hypothetical protein